MPGPNRPPASIADGYTLALEEARRALDEQERTVAHLSTRAGMLLSAAALVTSLFGGPVLARGSLGAAAWVAVAAFVAHGVTAMSILRPRRGFEFVYHPAGLIAEYLEPVTREPLAAERLHRELALQMSDSIDRNRVELEAMAMMFTASGVLLAIEIVAWVVSIAIAG